MLWKALVDSDLHRTLSIRFCKKGLDGYDPISYSTDITRTAIMMSGRT